MTKRLLIFLLAFFTTSYVIGETKTSWHLMSNADMCHLENGEYAITTSSAHGYRAMTDVHTNGYGNISSSGFAFTDSIATSCPEGTILFQLVNIQSSYYYSLKFSNDLNYRLAVMNASTDNPSLYKSQESATTDKCWVFGTKYLRWAESDKNYLVSTSTAITVASSSSGQQPVSFVRKISIDAPYSRTKGSVNMGTICLPYAVEQSGISGGTCYQLLCQNSDSSQITIESVDCMEAGMPYIYVMDENASRIQFTLSGTPVANTKHHNGLYGTFTDLQDGEAGRGKNRLEGNYLLTIGDNNQVILCKCAAKSKLNAFRAYVKLKEVAIEDNPQPSAPGRQLLTIGAPNIGPVTGLQEMSWVTVPKYGEKLLINGQLVIRKGGATFDVYGREMKGDKYE